MFLKGRIKFKKMDKEKSIRYSLRKLSIGLCSIVMGVLLVEQGQQNRVKAATTNSTTVVSTQNNTKLNDNNSSSNNSSNISDLQLFGKEEQAQTLNSNSTSKFEDSKNINTEVFEKTVNTNKAVGVKGYSTNWNYVPKNSTPNTWKNYNNNWYYYSNSGELNKNKGSWISGDLFYFDNNGAAVKNTWKQGGNDWYYFGNDGHAYKNRFSWMGSNLFYFKSNAAAATKMWKQGAKNWYYFGNDGHAYKNRGTWLGNNLFYFKSNAAAATNEWRQGGNNWYYFGNDGHAYRNRGAWLSSNLFYFNADGTSAKNTWKQGGNDWYYFGNNGHAYRNISTWINGSLYYFDNAGHVSAYQYTTTIKIANPQAYYKAVEDYGNFYQVGADGNYIEDKNGNFIDNPMSQKMTNQLRQMGVQGMMDNPDLDSSKDNRPINLNNITQAQQKELSLYAIDVINSVRQQVGVAPLYYDDKVQSLANDIAKYYLQDGASIWDSNHDFHAIVKAAKAHGIPSYRFTNENDPANSIEDLGGFMNYMNYNNGKSTMGEVKAQIYWIIKQMLFGGPTTHTPDTSDIKEFGHAYDLIKMDHGFEDEPNEDGSIPFALSISYNDARGGTASVHLITVGPASDGRMTR